MKKSIFKITWRTIKSFKGRYFALVFIVALSAGFFAGLKITTDAMRNTGEEFWKNQNFYDFRIFSTIGFSDEEVDAFSELEGVEKAEGAKSVDGLIKRDDAEAAYTFLSITSSVNLPHLSEGRLPLNETECIADDERFSESDIGKTISVNCEGLKNREYTIVGLADSPLYLGIDRGTTKIGNGSISGFIYINKENFIAEPYTELSITIKATAPLYSAEYEKIIKTQKDIIEKKATELSEKRYNNLLNEYGVSAELAQLMGYESPVVYVLTRDENSGYCSFENDTAILDGVANIFPVFFMMIAILVCITTMTRMVDEERTQLGVLKALGYSDGAITAKYMLYAGSATIIGWIIGFFLCTWALPVIFWFTYSVIYEFTPMIYYFDLQIAVVTFVVSLVGILSSTYFSCRRELKAVPANLIRPKTAKEGKRILLEKISFIWKKLSFLQKITLRNMFRYKQRMIMMLVGISCCTGLLITAFGLRDSMIGIGDKQFGKIQKYQLSVTFEGDGNQIENVLSTSETVESYYSTYTTHIDISSSKTVNSVNLIAFDDSETFTDFWYFYKDNSSIGLPDDNEIFINSKLAEKLNLETNDKATIKFDSVQTAEFTVGGIFENHIQHYVIISKDTFQKAFSKNSAESTIETPSNNNSAPEFKNNTMFVKCSETEKTASKLTEVECVASVSILENSKKTITEALSALNYVIWLVVFFSATLSFIVIFNLTNINIGERSREIATVRVLGFYPKETESYVLKENLILSALASILGIPLGIFFHRIVMSLIDIDYFSFDVKISLMSFCLSIVLTVFFAFFVNLFMKKNIEKIKMAESLKSAE